MFEAHTLQIYLIGLDVSDTNTSKINKSQMKQCKFTNRQFDSLSSRTRNKIMYKMMKNQMPFKQLKKLSLPTFTFSIYLYTVYIDLHPENHRPILS